jgi:hypothetical protein
MNHYSDKELINLFEGNNIKYKLLPKKEVKEYIKNYINNFVESDKKEKAIEVTTTTNHYNNYLWHIFSYNLVSIKRKKKQLMI